MAERTSRLATLAFALAMAGFPTFAGSARASELNGFALEDVKVERSEIIEAGPPPDSIRRVDAPEFADLAAAAKWVGLHNPVIGIALGSDARAYPVHLMEHHQIVNDRVADQAVTVTLDPLTSSPIAYRGSVGDQKLTFGFSGLLYRGGAVLYDLQTRSLWSQFTGEAIAGPLAGKQLERLRTHQEPLGIWIGRQPKTRVLVRPELKRIDYRLSPYSAYWVSEKHPPLLERLVDSTFHPKEVVLGVVAGKRSKVFLGSVMTAAGGRVIDELDGRKIEISYDGESASFIWEADESLQVVDAYWFAWKAHHPNAEVWQPKSSSSENK